MTLVVARGARPGDNRVRFFAGESRRMLETPGLLCA